jgi:hypothetical protein
VTEIQKAKLEVYTGLTKRTCDTIEGYIHIMNCCLENNDIKTAKNWQTREQANEGRLDFRLA